MSSNSLGNVRKKFLEFFVENGHKLYQSAPLVAASDASLLFTSAGMVPFKQAFISGSSSDGTKTAVSSQKCLRAGGKHNDLENVGYTNRHHTFFEMLGNFSFGDYFKDYAIELAWRFVTEELCLSRDRLLVTVYSEDQEAFDLWKKVTGYSDDRIIRISTSDNFWSMGDTGPCGPCSEIFYDYGEHVQGGPPGSKGGDGPRFTELWNLVFMQFDRNEHGELNPLPHKCIDTGMGLERAAAVLQGVCDNYDTDLFRAAIQKSQSVFGSPDNFVAHRVIADHIRAAAFLIAEGLEPGNEGRNYVLRRIIRRAVRYAYQLDPNNVAIHEVVPVLTQQTSAGYMGDAYPELVRCEKSIVAALKSEEEGFVDTLRRGMALLEREVSDLRPGDLLLGNIAFKLYDTFGFPLDITLDVAKEKGLKFDQQGFDEGMWEQKERSRKHWVGASGDSSSRLWEGLATEYKYTHFVGYERCSTKAAVLSIVRDGAVVQSARSGEQACVLLDISPFYAEAGGQEGDKGSLTAISKVAHSRSGGVAEVTYTKKVLNLHVHECIVTSGVLSVGDTVDAAVDTVRRERLKANHSATHILHSVLRTYISGDIQQKGSLVAEDKLRFDFNHVSALTGEQVALIEREVNSRIMSNQPVFTDNCSFEAAVKGGAVALFGEKYSENSVRVVSMGDSKELCCGTHVRYTGDIGAFRIVSESGIALGVRRIEAITGQAVIDSMRENHNLLAHLSERLKVPVNGVTEGLEKLLREKQELRKTLIEAWYEIIGRAVERVNCGSGVVLHLGRCPGIPVDVIVDFVKGTSKKNEILAIAAITDDKAVFVIGVGDVASKTLNALDLVKVLVDLRGKGGGNAGLARVSLEASSVERASEAIFSSVTSAFPSG
ncbi:alanine--tRNA ligase [Anaplasma capra]|uniref:alanine--tRNA ligase n=1 Tax=Anaplasma capra TaxID=1562740 RepID=UPI0021D5B4FC|nr:alanine--tRNA ligase [Anaplasma capra]MCU7611862.1 alanine--tRNA ligase [Anaplasma capra]MCU7612662.1 alanine--tRNA ligase [Anaplasma capra]